MPVMLITDSLSGRVQHDARQSVQRLATLLRRSAMLRNRPYRLQARRPDPGKCGYGRTEFQKARRQMKRIISVVLTTISLLSFCIAEETAFSGCKLADVKGKNADARLIFSDNNKNVVIRVADRD